MPQERRRRIDDNAIHFLAAPSFRPNGLRGAAVRACAGGSVPTVVEPAAAPQRGRVPCPLCQRNECVYRRRPQRRSRRRNKAGPQAESNQPSTEVAETALEPGVIAKLTVVSVASTSAVCEIDATHARDRGWRRVSLPDSEVEKLVEKNTLGNTRKYPMVIAFSEGDPLDEEVRDAIPRPPLPEVNQIRGRIGFDMSMIQQLGQGSSTSTEYGMIFRADFTRISARIGT
jgi:uncharacterized Zn finger protein (UPF0148 family)